MRNKMRHSARGAALLLLILPLFIGAPHARADGDNWDPDKVTELANRLAGEVKAMRAATRKEPQIIAASTTTKQRATAIYLETLKKLERTTGKLARQLSAGETREQTLGSARRIDALLRDAKEQGSKLQSTDWTHKFIEPIVSLVGELRSFYTEKPDSPAAP